MKALLISFILSFQVFAMDVAKYNKTDEYPHAGRIRQIDLAKEIQLRPRLLGYPQTNARPIH